MKRNSFLYAIAGIAAWGLASCSSSDDMQPEQPDGRVPVELTNNIIGAVTRAATTLNESALTTGDITVRTSEAYATAYTYTAGAGGAMTSTAPAYYPAGGASIDIVAYSPANANDGASETFTVSADQSIDNAYIASDLLWAKAEDKTSASGAVNIAFAHKMAKIIVNVTAGNGISTIQSITLKNIKRQCTFDYASGAVSNIAEVSGATDVAVTTGGTTASSMGAACIPAQDLSGDFIEITTDKGTATYRLSSAKPVSAGNYYTINLTLNLAAVGTTNTITGWTSEGTVVVNPVVEVETILGVTSDHLGWVIAGDGTIYPDKTAVEAAGKTGVAIIFYVGEPGSVDASSKQYRGLAASINTAGQQQWGFQDNAVYCLDTQYENYLDASADMNGIMNTQILASHAHTVSGYDRSHKAASAVQNLTPVAPNGTSGWFLGSVGQWKLFLGSCGISLDDSGLSEDATLEKMQIYFRAAGYESSWTGGKYWTSTECTHASNNTPRAWKVYLSTSSEDYISSGLAVLCDLRLYGAVARPFTAF